MSNLFASLRTPFALGLLLGLTLWATPAGATNDVTTPRSAGMGGALRAAPTGAAAIFLNPAGMPLIKAYVVQVFYDFHIRKNGHIAHSSIVDTQATKWVSAALYYNLKIFRPKVWDPTLGRSVKLKKDGHETGVSLAVPLGSRFSLGATLRYNYLRVRAPILDPDVDPPDPEQTVKRTVEKINNVGMDVGLMVMITKGLYLGATAMNIIPQKSVEYPISMGMGAAYQYKTVLTIAADLLIDFTSRKKVTLNGYGGLEVFVGGKFAIRAGARHLGLTKNTQVTAGFGYISKKVGVDIFLAQQVAGGIETQVGFGFRTFFGAK